MPDPLLEPFVEKVRAGATLARTDLSEDLVTGYAERLRALAQAAWAGAPEPRLERFRVLTAALDTPEFTVRDLATRAGVTTDYVHKLVSDRDSQYFEPTGQVPSGGRGRPATRYRVAAAQADQLRALLTGPNTDPTGLRAATADEPSDELLSAEHVLLYELPAARTPAERDSMLRMIDYDLKGAAGPVPFRSTSPVAARPDAAVAPRPDAPRPDAPRPLSPRLQAARTMFELAQVGVALAGGSAVVRNRAVLLVELTQLLFKLGRLARDVDGKYAATVDAWLAEGPLAKWRVLLEPAVGLVCLVRAGIDEGVRTVADHVAAALKSVAPRLTVHDHAAADPVEPAAGVTLLACSSAVEAAQYQILAAIDRWRQAAGGLFVLDAVNDLKFRKAVLRHRAQYVPAASQLEPPELLVEVPELAELAAAPQAV